MKRLITAGVILLIICIVAFSCVFALRQITQELLGSLKESVEYMERGETEKAYESAQRTEAFWNRSEPILSLFIAHQDLDPIALSIAKILPYLRNGDDTNFIVECETCIVQLYHLYRTGSFSLEIF